MPCCQREAESVVFSPVRPTPTLSVYPPAEAFIETVLEQAKNTPPNTLR
jgi:hypothetical protein